MTFDFGCPPLSIDSDYTRIVRTVWWAFDVRGCEAKDPQLGN